LEIPKTQCIKGDLVLLMTSIRKSFQRIPGARSSWQFALAIRKAYVRPSPPEHPDAVYRSGDNPWGYGSERHKERFQAALEMIARACRVRSSNALEIGCSEGLFTELLAPATGRLLAVDISGLALERAQIRLVQNTNVEFEQFDLLTGKLDQRFDLVVAMDVLPYFLRRGDLRRASENIVSLVADSGVLLLSVTRPPAGVVEDPWWSGLLPRGKNILDQFDRDRRLEMQERLTTTSHYLGTYRMKS
jgi:SAM-dependent methyltransferase